MSELKLRPPKGVLEMASSTTSRVCHAPGPPVTSSRNEVVATLGENHIIASLGPKRRCQTNIELVGFALGAVGRGVEPQRIARANPFQHGVEHGIERRRIRYVEDLPAGLLRNLADVHQSGNDWPAPRIVSGYFQVIYGSVRRSGFGDDVLGVLSAAK